MLSSYSKMKNIFMLIKAQLIILDPRLSRSSSKYKVLMIKKPILLKKFKKKIQILKIYEKNLN